MRNSVNKSWVVLFFLFLVAFEMLICEYVKSVVDFKTEQIFCGIVRDIIDLFYPSTQNLKGIIYED